MKLSEAIREGAKLRPQAFGDYFRVAEDGVLCSCAIGAAYEGFTHKTNIYVAPFSPFWDEFPELLDWLREPLVMPHGKETLYLKSAIAKLNDDYKWTRNQIADWLEEQGY